MSLLRIAEHLHGRYGLGGSADLASRIKSSAIGLSPTIRETPALEVIYDQVEYGYPLSGAADENHSIFLVLYLRVEDQRDEAGVVEKQLLELTDALVEDLLEGDRTLGGLVDLALPAGIDFSVPRRGTAFFRSAALALSTGNPPPQLY